MLDNFESTIITSLQTIFDQFGWLGVFALMIFENATGISPSEVVLAFAGWMLIERHGISPSFIFVAGAYAGFGSAIGASITYWVARIGGKPVVEKFCKFFRIKTSMIQKAEDQMNKWGASIILFGRMLPAVRTLINIPAGIAKVPFLKFFVATFLGAYIWCTLLIGAGYVLGHEWIKVSEYIRTHIPLVFSIILFGIGLYLIYHFRERLPKQVWVYFQKNKIKKDEQE